MPQLHGKKHKIQNVLLCDDDAGLRQALADLLRLQGLTPFEAGKAAKAMELARQVPMDFGFFDFQLPDMDGATAVRMLRRESIIFPYVIMSGESALARQHGSGAGAVGFLAKPLQFSQIKIILHTYL